MPEKIQAETRTEFGKGAARRIRRDNKVPAVIYGHGNEPIHLTLPGHDTWLALKNGGSNALLEIEVDGGTQLALTKQVQVDPIRRTLEHIDFVSVRRGEKVNVDVALVLVGEAGPDTLVVAENVIELEVEATHIPESVEIDITDAPIGTQVLASELVLPEGATLLTDPDALLVNITQQQSAEALEAELEEAEAEAGIERDESDEELEAADGDTSGDAEETSSDEE